MADEEFFIGWGATPDRDRRFLLRAAIGLVAGGAGVALLAAGAHRTAGAGTWDQAAVRTFSGRLVRTPFPGLVTTDIDTRPRTLLLGGYGKLGIDARLAGLEGAVQVRGSLIVRGANAMIAVLDSADAISAGTASAPVQDFRETDRGPATMTGEILDAKCWFGAMRPGEGKVHKSCASLCIRGGLPIVFCGATCSDAVSAPLFVNQFGQRHDTTLLPFAADPILASGRLVQLGDVLQFRVAVEDIVRL